MTALKKSITKCAFVAATFLSLYFLGLSAAVLPPAKELHRNLNRAHGSLDKDHGRERQTDSCQASNLSESSITKTPPSTTSAVPVPADLWAIPGTPLSRTTGTTDDFWDYLECDEIYKQRRPLHNESTWIFLRGVYHGIVGPRQSSIPSSPAVPYGNGFQVEYYTGYIPGDVGRGVFAGQDIEKGQLIWTERESAVFTSGDQFRQFLLALPTHMACDVLNWAYSAWDNGTVVIQCDLDDCSFMNSGSSRNESKAYTEEFTHLKANVGIADYGNYALRDIQAGEQLLVDYGEFEVGPEAWTSMGL